MIDQHKTPVSPQVSDEITLRDIFGQYSWAFLPTGLYFFSVCLGLAVAFVFQPIHGRHLQSFCHRSSEETENPLASSIDGMLNLGLGFGGNGIVDTRIAVLKSFAHNRSCRTQCQPRGHRVYNKGRLNKREVYQPEHFSVEFDPFTTNSWAEFSITFEKTGYALDIFSSKTRSLTCYNFQVLEMRSSRLI